MTPISVPHRWLAALLGLALLLDLLLLIEGPGSPRTSTMLALCGAAVFAVCAFLGVNRPAISAIVGAGVLTLSSLLLRAAEIETSSIGLEHILLTETISGTVLVVLVVWHCTPLIATACTTALVAACLVSVFIRDTICAYSYCDSANYGGYYSSSPGNIAQTGLFGLILLIAAITAGVYLRRSAKQKVETEMGALVRTQWPLGAALAVLGLVELAQAGGENVLMLIGAVGAAVCAFFGTRYPLRATYLAAGSITLMTLVSAVFGADNGWPVSLTGVAASMALIAYVVRYTQVRQAALATATLVVATLLSMRLRSPSVLDDVSFSLLLLFLLLVAVVAGWYFRARDRERNQTVRAAVTSAQQGERMALARELHDVVAHHVTGIVVQAQAALMVAETNPGVALPALARIEHSGTEALNAMRTLVGSLRDGTAAWTAGNSEVADQATTDLSADIRGLVENFTGPPTELELDLPDQLPHEVGRSVLRLVQESLTNVGKHAPDAGAVRVRVAYNGEGLHVRVTDDGAKRPVNPAGGSGGYGLVGMRERVELLGGRFEAGPSGYVGWSVEAWLPLRKEGGERP